MSFGFSTLALIAVIGMAGGPVLASVPRLRIPLVIGELAVGLLVGRTGFGIMMPAIQRSACSPTSDSRW